MLLAQITWTAPPILDWHTAGSLSPKPFPAICHSLLTCDGFDLAPAFYWYSKAGPKEAFGAHPRSDDE